MSMRTAPRPVAVDELRRAWLAVQAGDFRAPHRTHRPAPTRLASSASDGGQFWSPSEDESVVLVVGSAGSSGATTVALALATAVDGPARVVECAPPTASGLAAASTAELGAEPSGWVRGTRDRVVLERAGSLRPPSVSVLQPSQVDGPMVTVVDAGRPLDQILFGAGWLTGLLASDLPVVVTARATVPGMRRLESCLGLLDTLPRVIAAVVGPARKRWPREVSHSLGRLTLAVIEAGQLVVIPEDRSLAVNGLTPVPLPASVVASAASVLSVLSVATVSLSVAPLSGLSPQLSLPKEGPFHAS